VKALVYFLGQIILHANLASNQVTQMVGTINNFSEVVESLIPNNFNKYQ
jgi:hypothetical protein